MRVGIDGDIIVYRAAAAAEPTRWDIEINGHMVASFRYKKEAITWVEEQGDGDFDRFELVRCVDLEPEEHAFNLINIIIRGIKEATGAEETTVFLTPEDRDAQFRFQVATVKPYKAKRGTKPHHYAACRDFLMRRWGAKVATGGREADDELGIFQYPHWERLMGEDSEWHDETCIATIDKDLDMIPGWHYNFVDKRMYWVKEVDAWRTFYKQMITGDSVDNIPGVPGKGPKSPEVKALAEMTHPGEMERLVFQAYEEKYGDYARDRFHEQGLLLWIARERVDR